MITAAPASIRTDVPGTVSCLTRRSLTSTTPFPERVAEVSICRAIRADDCAPSTAHESS
ncbi:hypothetical protein KGD82_13625 [Nocardiopsis eucommiae]|uniref:Uncharacterized protein n=1 Tax=Nocardiopsis eucommiae TaxID=2831970 RepID=A0A975LBP4_9ACTN|nr:hypothetical protein KGD82_13625 [Nocardiopsis eucommiae]